MEVKVTLEAGQSLIDLVNILLQGLSRQTITSIPTEKKTKKQLQKIRIRMMLQKLRKKRQMKRKRHR